MNNKKLKIGILGGMGPVATSYFYGKIIKILQRKYGLVEDYEYPEIIIYNISLDGITEDGIMEKEKTREKLKRSAFKIQEMGADFLVIPCNTAHYFYLNIQEAISIPVIDIREEIAEFIFNKNCKKIGICATKSSLNLNIFKKAFTSKGIEILKPDKEKEEIITAVILRVMQNLHDGKDKINLKKIAKYFENRGADGMLLGCTELPVALEEEKINNFYIFNSSSILAEAAVDYSVNYEFKKIPKLTKVREN